MTTASDTADYSIWGMIKGLCPNDSPPKTDRHDGSTVCTMKELAGHEYCDERSRTTALH